MRVLHCCNCAPCHQLGTSIDTGNLTSTVFQSENSALGPKWPLQPIFGGLIFQGRVIVQVQYLSNMQKVRQLGS